MKKLIAAHRTNIYQICKCFRNRESSGQAHSPEFTMLEYYTMEADYTDSLDITEALFAALVADAGMSAGAAAGLSPPFERLTMDEAFSRIAGFSLNEQLENGTLRDEARRLGLDVSGARDDGDVYNLIFIHVVEPALPRDRPVALLDYPAVVPCLAADGRSLTRQRWELYACGIELANCYSEETDAGTVRDFFLSEQREKERSGTEPHAVDGDYWKMFLPGRSPDGSVLAFPRCSGVALGLDRLIMALTGRKTIDAALPFPMETG
jgi:lysyl-tRNA synthetase class 2